MIENKIQDNTAENGVSYFVHCCLPTLCENTHTNNRSE